MSEIFTAVKGGLLWDGTGADSIKDGVILIEGSKIAGVGSSNDVEIPKGTNVIDASGKTVMPGLMDLHVHIFEFQLLDLLEKLKEVRTKVDCGLLSLALLFFHGFHFSTLLMMTFSA